MSAKTIDNFNRFFPRSPDPNYTVTPGSEAHHALRLSIGKWIHLSQLDDEAARDRVDEPSTITCALCNLYATGISTQYETWCASCPVAHRTGKRGCADTPISKTCIDAPSAWKEVQFLKSMLPDSDPLKHAQTRTPA